jgi:ABC-type Fe3+-hydroxamate transport system substrate-binding protein
MGRKAKDSFLPFRDLFFSLQKVQYISLHLGEELIIPQTNEYLIFIIERGQGRLKLVEQNIDVQSREIIMKESKKNTSIENFGEEVLRFYLLRFKAFFYENKSVRVYMERTENQIIPLRSFIEMTNSLKELLLYSNSLNEYEQFQASFLFQKLIYKLTEEVLFQHQTTHSHITVEETIQYISKHFHESISVDQLARMTNLSRRWYTTLFKEKTGHNPCQYITELRVKRAKELLNYSKDSIREIARKVGFQDEYYFSRRFKQMVGMSPRFYLKNRKYLGTAVIYPELMYALGIIPIAAASIQQEFPYYLKEPFKHVPKLGPCKSLELTQIRSARPDLIIASEWKDCSLFDELNQIAPTILLPERDNWREELLDLGEIIGNRNKALQVIQLYEEEFAQIRERFKAFLQNETIIYVRVSLEEIIYFGKKSSRGSIFYHELGLKAPEVIFVDDDGGRLSFEQLINLNADHIILHLDSSEGMGQKLLEYLQTTDLSKLNKHIYLVSNVEWYNFSFSPLSTNYALQQLLSKMETTDCFSLE